MEFELKKKTIVREGWMISCEMRQFLEEDN